MVFCGCLWDPLENTQLSFSFYGSMDDEAELLLNVDKCKDFLSLHPLIAKDGSCVQCPGQNRLQDLVQLPHKPRLILTTACFSMDCEDELVETGHECRMRRKAYMYCSLYQR